MDVTKKKEKFLKRLRSSQFGEKVKVIEFKRKHFKSKLSTEFGFGVQDLRNKPKEFYNWLIISGYDISVEPKNLDPFDFSVLITVKKEKMDSVYFVGH
jgi:hypothetical protein